MCWMHGHDLCVVTVSGANGPGGALWMASLTRPSCDRFDRAAQSSHSKCEAPRSTAHQCHLSKGKPPSTR